eukprot:scaffold323314_cov30-Tisochrysis_lutea.AAC.2
MPETPHEPQGGRGVRSPGRRATRFAGHPAGSYPGDQHQTACWQATPPLSETDGRIVMRMRAEGVCARSSPGQRDVPISRGARRKSLRRLHHSFEADTRCFLRLQGTDVLMG